MSKEGYIYNIITKIQSAWTPDNADQASKVDNNSDPVEKDVDISLKDQSSKVSLDSESSVNDQTFSQKVTNIFSGYYNYYKSNDELKSGNLGSADHTSPMSMSNAAESQSNQNDSNQNESAAVSKFLGNLFSKKNEPSNDRTLVPSDLLAEIKSSGGVIKLNKVENVKVEKRADDLTAILSSVLNARKNVIMDPEDEDNSEWDDN